MEIIVTDLTKFANEDIVCTAGIEKDSNECIRPIPYLKRNFCEAKKIETPSVVSIESTGNNYTEELGTDRKCFIWKHRVVLSLQGTT